MIVNKRTATFSIIWALLTVVAICLAPTNIFSVYDGDKYYAGIIYWLLIGNLFKTGYGSLSLNDHLGYFATLLMFILPIIFIFVVWKGGFKSIRLFSLAMLLPVIFLFYKGYTEDKIDIIITMVYFVMTLVQVILWFKVENPDAYYYEEDEYDEDDE